MTTKSCDRHQALRYKTSKQAGPALQCSLFNVFGFNIRLLYTDHYECLLICVIVEYFKSSRRMVDKRVFHVGHLVFPNLGDLPGNY